MTAPAAVTPLEVNRLSKRFGGVVAVKDVEFAVQRGEILGLIGPNGSGKSTVMKLIMGIERPDAGSVRIKGTEVANWSAHRIARLGVRMLFQHSRPLHRQTVLENIILALLPDKLTRLLPDQETSTRAREIAERVGLGSVTRRLPGALTFADLRKLELAKAIARDPQVLLIDEPFAGLTPSETLDFVRLIVALRAADRAILLVDHNVKSVSAIVDRFLVLYLGERIAQGSAAEVMQNPTVRRVYLGENAQLAVRARTRAPASAPFLHLDNVSVQYGKARALENVSLRVDAGEFVSVVGLNGAGKTTLFNAISGLVPYSGEIRHQNGVLRGHSAAAIARSGVAQCPERRELFSDMTVRENLDLGAQNVPAAQCESSLTWLFELFPVLKSRQKQTAGTLSGGEQQMLTIARALMMRPKLLILDEPTLGLAPVILEQLSQALDYLRQQTAITVLLGEQNLTFALPHSDRIYVLERGRIVWEGDPERFAAEAGTGYL
ncbi:MAG TPA: ATP-binding cassette domain-containing protein [Steroidobacteraceae bacterium]|nr:ATP-binding cassette domain-containing protein [Steroidobacteraceae bacterium]